MLLVLSIDNQGDGLRLDRALALAAAKVDPGGDVPQLSRARIRELLQAGRVTAIADPETPPKATRIARAGESYQLQLPPPPSAQLAPEPVKLDILHEDEWLLVVNKPAGMVTHPSPGNETGTLVNALLAHCDGALSATGLPWRPGIVHRIDKGTSGLLVIAKTDPAHSALAVQFAEHRARREYQAIAWGEPRRAESRLGDPQSVRFETGGWIRVETRIGVHPAIRTRMAVVAQGGRNAVTRIRVMARAGTGAAAVASLLRCRLETGRTHQIRVHLAHLGHPLVGDTSYGRTRTVSETALDLAGRRALGEFARPALHAGRLGFEHPATGERLDFRAPPPADFQSLIDCLWPRTAPNETTGERLTK